MDTRLNTKRILIFLAFAFGIPWTSALVVYLTPQMQTNPIVALSTVNTIFIATPWLGNIAARLITGEGWGRLWLRPNFKRGWRFYLGAWFLPVLATIVGGAIFYLLFPQSFDPNLGALQALTAGTASAAANPWLIFLSTALSMILVSSLINCVVSFGEEFGWRAYLLPNLVERFAGSDSADGSRKAALLTGLIHGVWHWPLLLMAMSFTPGMNLLTPVVYLVYTCALSILLSWATLRSGSVWPAALGHGSANAASALPGFMLNGAAIPLLGPDVTGLIGGLGYVFLALVLLFNRKAYAQGKEVQSEASQVVAEVESV